MAKKALLMILDGWGIGKHGKGDVIYNTPTPYLDYLNAVAAFFKTRKLFRHTIMHRSQASVCT